MGDKRNRQQEADVPGAKRRQSSSQIKGHGRNEDQQYGNATQGSRLEVYVHLSFEFFVIGSFW